MRFQWSSVEKMKMKMQHSEYGQASGHNETFSEIKDGLMMEENIR